MTNSVRWHDPNNITDTGGRCLVYQSNVPWSSCQGQWALHSSRFSPEVSKTLSIGLWTRYYVNTEIIIFGISNLRANSNVPWNWAVILSDVMSLSRIVILPPLSPWLPSKCMKREFGQLNFYNLLEWFDTNIVHQSTRVNRHEPGNGAGNHQRSR